MERKPWIEGSLEVLELAIEQYYMSLASGNPKDSNRYLRVALINADDAVELAMKAFIQYQKGEFASRKFHTILTWIKKNGPSLRICLPKGLEGKIRYYHNARDTLYHHGYSLRLSRLEVLDYIAKATTLFRLLFGEELERSFQFNPRRLLLLSYAEFEKQLVDLASINNVPVNDKTDVGDMIQYLIEKEVIEEDIREMFQQSTTLLERVIPKAESLTEIGDVYELALTLSESIPRMSDKTEKLSKQKAGKTPSSAN